MPENTSESLIKKVRRADDPFNSQSSSRRDLLREIGRRTGCDVAVLYHNLIDPTAMLSDDDGEMLESVLSAAPPRRKLLLIVNSNGGLPLAAERLVHTVRTYAPRGFHTMVVQKAKSAATMVCLGSDKVYMAPTAELGPIDPQFVLVERGVPQWISVDSYLDSYDTLMSELRKVDMEAENPSGLLQQLQAFDPAVVEEYRKAQELGRAMVGKFLEENMLAGKTPKEIQKVVQTFSESKKHKSHGRPIWPEKAATIGLNVEIMKQGTKLWAAAYELLLRYNHLMELEQDKNNARLVKLIETTGSTFTLRTPLGEQ